MLSLNFYFKCLSEYLAHRSGLYTNILAIKPTGWEFSKTGQGFSSKSFNKDTVTIIGKEIHVKIQKYIRPFS
jgi:hypothetical protein